MSGPHHLKIWTGSSIDWAVSGVFALGADLDDVDLAGERLPTPVAPPGTGRTPDGGSTGGRPRAGRPRGGSRGPLTVFAVLAAIADERERLATPADEPVNARTGRRGWWVDEATRAVRASGEKTRRPTGGEDPRPGARRHRRGLRHSGPVAQAGGGRRGDGPHRRQAHGRHRPVPGRRSGSRLCRGGGVAGEPRGVVLRAGAGAVAGWAGPARRRRCSRHTWPRAGGRRPRPWSNCWRHGGGSRRRSRRRGHIWRATADTQPGPLPNCRPMPGASRRPSSSQNDTSPRAAASWRGISFDLGRVAEAVALLQRPPPKPVEPRSTATPPF